MIEKEKKLKHEALESRNLQEQAEQALGQAEQSLEQERTRADTAEKKANELAMKLAKFEK